MENRICIDWLSFTTKIHSISSILSVLGMEDCTFESLTGRYGYRDRLHFNGVNILYNGRENMGLCVEMSGSGCRTFEEFGNGDYFSIFDEIRDNYNENKELRQMNITRIDIAYDDFNDVLDLDLLAQETINRHYSSRFKEYQVIVSNKGNAVNHGSMSSKIYIRFYDKRKQMQVEDKIPHWVRAEVQIRAENAYGFICLDEPIEEKYFHVLNRYLRYIEPCGNTTNLSEVATADYWLKFIENEEQRAIYCKPADDYTFLNLQSFVLSQVSGSISTYIDVVGVDTFLQDIYNAREGKPLNTKYKSIKDKTCSPGSGILEYLEAHGLNKKKGC